MCGINGIIRFDGKSPNSDDLSRMMQRQRHRGPNDNGIFIDRNVGFGFVRLSILDLSMQGHQPMTDLSGNYTIIFNGEIYNYLEIRQELEQKGIIFKSNSDTEVLLASYIHWGKECLHRLNGMFAFVIYDKQNNSVFGARDRFGVKPFYYYRDNEQFIFASEIPPIIEVYPKENRPNEAAIYEYLLHNRTDQTENTFFENINKLQHGYCFEIKDGKFSMYRWYDIRKHISKQEADTEKYKELLIDAVRLRMRSDVPVGVCLSGGIDSSTLTSIMHKELGISDIHTFSAVYQQGEVGDESSFINLYKSDLSNMHFTTPDACELLQELKPFIRLHAEPIPSTSPFAQYCVMRLAAQNVTVTIDGQGADEALAGYHYFFGFYFKELLKKCRLFGLIREIYHYVKKHHSTDGIKFLVYFILPSKLKNRVSSAKNGYVNPDFVRKMALSGKNTIIDELYSSSNIREALINHFEYKLEHLLKWGDRNSMFFSIESRTPFLDYRLVEYSLSLPAEIKIRKGTTKYILRKAMKGILPEPIRQRADKIGFDTPQDKWFRLPEFQNIINDILNSNSFRNRGYIDAEKAKELYARHLSGEVNISKDIWKWLHLELWFREFIDNQTKTVTKSQQ